MILRHAIIFVLTLQVSQGSTYSLSSLLKSIDHQHVLSKSLQQEKLFLDAKNRADTATDPIELYVEGTRAHPKFDKSGNEYAFGVTKTFKLGDIREQEARITELSNQAYLLDEEKNIINFQNSIKNIYHHHCMDVKSYQSHAKSYQAFQKLFKKKQKAFKYQEISKMELMHLEMEKNRLHTLLQEKKMQKETSKKNLLGLTNISPKKHVKLSCKDTYPIRSNVSVKNAFNLTREAHEKRLKSTEKTIQRYDSKLGSIDLSAQYAKELDIDRYTIGVSIPLHFSSSKREEERVAAMYKSSSLTYMHEHIMREKKSLLRQLQSHLKSTAFGIQSLKKNYANYRKKLLPLMKRSYDLGEISVIEYLLSRQKSYQLQQEIYDTQK